MKNPRTLVEMLRERALERPESVALTFLLDGEDRTAPLTYAELDRRARAIAAVLVDGGAKPGERALLLCDSGIEFVCGLFGVLYARMIAVPGYPLDPTRLERSLERLHRIAEDARPTRVLSMAAMRQAVAGEMAKLPALAPARWLDLDADAPLPANGPEPAGSEPDDVAILQYTSGSTGAPKGVVLTDANVMANQAQIQVANEHSADTVFVAWVPLFHDMGLIAHLFQSIYLGAHAVLMTPLHFLQRPSRWLRAISKYRGTTSGAPNFAYDLCVQRGGAEEWAGLDLSSWRRAVSGGEPVRLDTCERFARTFAPYGLQPNVISPTYGMAEAAALISSTPHGVAPLSFPAEPGGGVRRGSVAWVAAGPPCPDTSVLAVDPDTLCEVAPGEVGELWIQGPQVARGYWNDPVRSREVFDAHLASGAGPYLRTGDLGTLRDGVVYVTGRRKDMIVVRGENHYPQDIEATLEGVHPSLRPGCGIAFAVSGPGGEELVIVHEVDARRLGDPEAVLDLVQTRIVQEHGLRPRAICLIEARSIPKTSSGKLARTACREEYRAGRLRIVARRGADPSVEALEPPPPTTARVPEPASAGAASRRAEIEAWMRAWVAERRGGSAAELAGSALDQWGLDSAEAVGLVAELGRMVGRELPPTLLWERPTVEAVSAFALGELPSTGRAAPADGGAETAVAVVGMGCRFPGRADGPEAFWQLLVSGTDAIEEVPEGRWDLEHLYDPEPGTPGKLYVRHGGFVRDIDRFDAAFFGISPAEAAAMDPQQRLLLETTLEAIEDAGLSPRELEGRRVGVFIGISTCDYAFLQVRSGDPERFSAYVGTGVTSSVAAGRIAHVFGFTGPCLAVDTACSSSLVALHLAATSLRRGECDLAIVGGVNALLSPELTVFSCQAGTLAPDGRCKSFDESADGYVRAEGCGVVVLRRESEALAARQRPRARLRGSAMNHDGRALALTAPSGLAQTEVIRAALADARVSPAWVGYVEAHGSGTKLGDPIEVRSLGEVYAAERDAAFPLRIGSVKTNVGHLEAAAGICGFIKVVLALEHGQIPPQLHCAAPNQRVPWADLKIAVADRLLPWLTREGLPRIAAVSSFGISGTNAHVVLEAAPAPLRAAPSGDPSAELLTLSARDREALWTSAERTARYLRAHAAEPHALADACFTAQVSRSDHPHRLAVRGKSPEEVEAQLTSLIAGEPSRVASSRTDAAGRAPRIAYLFSGQGTQYPGMGRELFESEPVFRSALTRCAQHLGPIFLGRDLLSLLFSRADDMLLHETAMAQPALFAVQIALAETLRSWGVLPAVVMGHSAGELAAACVAGVFDWRTGLELATARGRLMQSLPRGGLMAAVEWDERALAGLVRGLPDDVAVAAYNGPGRLVLSGRRETVEKIGAELQASGARFTPLAVSHASHSPFMEPILEEFEKAVRNHTLSAPAQPLVSNLSGALAGAEIATPVYWRRHLREPVRFDLGLDALEKLAPDVYLELGPHPTLLGVVAARHPDASEHAPLHVPTLRRGQGDREQMLETLAQLYVAGAPIAWRAVAGERELWRVALPGHPLRRKRFWLGDAPGSSDRHAHDGAARTSASRGPDLARSLHALVWERDASPGAARELPPQRRGVWWLLDQDTELGRRAAERLRASGARVRLVRAAAATRCIAEDRFEVDVADPRAWDLLLEGEPPCAVLHLWALEAQRGDSDAAEQAERLCRGALGLLRALAGQERDAAPRLWIAAAGAEAAAVSGPPAPQSVAAAALLGLARVLEFEHPEFQCTTVDLPVSEDPAQVLDGLWAELCAEHGGERVAYRDRARLLPRLGPAPLAERGGRIDATGAYVVTGGAGTLGLRVAHWLVARGVRDLTLISRHAPSDERAQSFAQLAQRCPGLRHRRADVAERTELAQVLGEIRAEGRALRGVFHLAGVLDEAPLLRTDGERLSSALAAKLRGAWHLHELTREDSLASFVLFSSMSALIGPPGQGSYAAANAFLDALAHHRRARGLPAVSINWGAWEGEGMAPLEAQQRLARRGFELLRADLALRALEAVLAADPVQIAVAPADEQALRSLAASSQTSSGRKSAGWSEALRAVPAPARIDQCARRIRTLLRDVLGLDAAAEADVDAPFLDLGMDSLMAVELRNAVSRGTGLRLPASFAFDAGTLRGAAATIVERLGLMPATPAARSAANGRNGLDALPAAELLELAGEALQQLRGNASRER